MPMPALLRLLLLLAACSSNSLPGTAGTLTLHARGRVRGEGEETAWVTVQRTLEWQSRQTAIVVCDMWDRHWCRGASDRVAEMAPRMNRVLQAARAHGVLIVHAPSDTMGFYANTPQRQRALQEAGREAAPDLNRWHPLDRDREPPLPVDDSDGGCDDDPPCAQGRAWSRQTPLLEIAPADLVSDQGAEILELFDQAQIRNVIVMGVHANMCILGRPFAIRAMVARGRNVVLMRDLTDTMYNSRRAPFVSHFAGTDLVVDHVEKYWCPSVTSVDFVGGEPFRFAADVRPKVAIVIGEDEYQTDKTLPRFVAAELAWRGVRPVVVMEDPTDRHSFPGIQAALAGADVLVLSTRRRALPVEAMRAVRAHVAAGRAVVGIRTASHAFAVREPERALLAGRGLADWPEFDPEVLGGSYRGHHGAGPETVLSPAAGAAGDPLLRGVDFAGFRGHGSLYRCAPLAPGTRLLVTGSIPGQPEEPVTWVREVGGAKSRVFYTSLGHPKDFEDARFRRLLLNGILWGCGLPVPPAG